MNEPQISGVAGVDRSDCGGLLGALERCQVNSEWLMVNGSDLKPNAKGLTPNAAPLAVYIHTPFCPTKCGYCDFNSYAMSGEVMERTTQAMVEEIRRSPAAGRPAKTIFFGGGTPTYLPEDQLLRILEAALEAHPLLPGAEVTSEANPGTADAGKFRAMQMAGFNRLSLGAQSFVDSDLVRLGRVHRAGEIERAVDLAREAGFDNLNLDLMFALPGQSRRAWSANLERALALRPEHLSLYCLTLEPNTPFYKEHLRGQLTQPDDDDQVAMYEACLDATTAAGFQQYEISNFSKPGLECRHNLCYWAGEEYAGYGPGAVGFLSDDRSSITDHRSLVRYTNLKHPDRYCAAVEADEPIAYEVEEITPATHRVERVMLGLRLNTGIDRKELGLQEEGVEKLRTRGWVEVIGDRLRLTKAGRHFCSEATLELI